MFMSFICNIVSDVHNHSTPIAITALPKYFMETGDGKYIILYIPHTEFIFIISIMPFSSWYM